MLQKVLLPKLGQTMEEATIERWLKKEGDAVAKGDVLLEITTDKATLEVEAFVPGTLRKVFAEEGQILPVNAVLALVGEADEALPDNFDEYLATHGAAESAPAAKGKAEEPSAETPSAAAPAAATVPPPPPRSGRIFISPRARKKAEKEHVPISILRGSGPEGRIVEKDVLDYLERRKAVKVTPTALVIACERGVDVLGLTGSGTGDRITKEDVLAAPAASAAGEEKRVELSAMRRVVAQRLTQAKQQIPHFYLMMEMDMTAAAALRKKLNAEGKTRIGFHDMIIKACAMGFIDNPAMNASWAGDAILQRGEINIGVAVAIEEGLMVPVVHNVDRMSLEQIARASKDLIDRTRSKKLTPDEYEGGCLTISNLGMYDIDTFIPIINPGESAILGIGRITEKTVVKDNAIYIRSMMSVCLSGDHRVVDGAVAAQFLKAVKDRLEDPEQLI